MAAPMALNILVIGLQTLLFMEQTSADNAILSVKDIAFLIRSQKNEVHARRAEQTKINIESQCEGQGGCDVVLIHQKYTNLGSWTILPLLPRLVEEFPNKKWLFFCEEETQVNLAGLLDVLQAYDSSQPLFLGKALVDQRPSIIHHYMFHDDVSKFKFPDFEAGWLISRELLQEVAEWWKDEPPEMNFSIDVKHEVALYIWNEGNGVSLTNVPELCADGSELPQEYPGEGCVTQHPAHINQCGDPVPQEEVLFAVKTCEKYHKSRAEVVLNTWGHFTDHVIYYSDVADSSIPTVIVNVPNVERGHCSKTLEMMKNFHEDIKQQDYDWLVISDDDTILSVDRLLKLLSCYDASKDVFLGERYGYAHSRMFGYDYITGGGGMVFSRAAVSALFANDIKCSNHEDPDDMILGMFAKRFEIPVTHCPLFHQTQPEQYALGYLKHQIPISFHKHTNLDPYVVYQDWFYDDDDAMRRRNAEAYMTSMKDEL